MPNLTVAVLYGGKSSEHEVSIHSAQSVCETLEKKYKVLKVFISKECRWYLQEVCGAKQPSDKEISPVVTADSNLYTIAGERFKADIFFPVLHGAMGEDGTIQGMFEILNVPYVGCGVLTSALGMDKELCKLLASFYGIPIVPYVKLESSVNYEMPEIKKAVSVLGYPLFVKPMSLGSSIGVTRVDKEEELEAAIEKAFKYEGSILIEKGIDKAREIFCGVLGLNSEIHTSLCGELAILNSKFFDYKAKYEDPHGCDIIAPAGIPQALQDKMRKASHDIFKVLRGTGLARVDFLLGEDGYYFSEINTMPGFSHTSLFPQLWQATGKDYADILDILIHLALQRKKITDSFSIER